MNNRLLKSLLVLFIIVIFISFAVIYFTFDVRALQYLTMFQPWSIAGAFGVLFLGLFFDALRLITLCRIADEKLTFEHVGNVVLSNYFLALLTPGASGGAVAQVLFMKKAGIPMAKSTVIILVRTIMSILFLFFLVPFIFYFDHKLVGFLPNSVIFLAAFVFISLPVIALYLMTTEIPDRFISRCSRRFKEETQEKILYGYREFKGAAFLIGKNPLMILRAFLESGISLLCIYSVVPVFFKGFGLDIPLYITMGRMCLLNLILYFTPTPGGTGVAEGGFVLLFASLLPEGIVGIMAVLWRFMCEYVPFMIGAVISLRAFGSNILNQFRLKKLEGGEEE